MKSIRYSTLFHLQLIAILLILIGSVFLYKINREIIRSLILTDAVTGEQRFPTISAHDNHAIPNILIFTYSKNLLEAPTETLDVSEILHIRNIQKTISLHPTAQIRFLDDAACLRSISNVLGSQSKLLEYFSREGFGPFKADMCRGAALYETGGLYFDLDIHALMSVWSVLPKDTQFVVPKSSGGGRFEGFFQAFVGSVKSHPIWKLYLLGFEDIYENREHAPGAPGVIILWHSYLRLPPNFKEKSMIWQEERFNQTKFPSIAPPVGFGNCQYVVYMPSNNIVLFYSRIFGSRACNKK